jgi:hypothetical protein
MRVVLEEIDQLGEWEDSGIAWKHEVGVDL